MPKYHLTYAGVNEMPETEADMAVLVQAWQGWFADLGTSLVDPGNAFGLRQTISAQGAVSDAGLSSGFGIVEADDLAGAVTLAKGCPILVAGGSVEVSECLDM